MSEWRSDMENAPRDRAILVYGQPTDLVLHGETLVQFNGPVVCAAAWDSIDEAFVPVGGSWLGPLINAATHWQPLPSLPEPDSNAQ